MTDYHRPITPAEENYIEVALEWFRRPTPHNELRRGVALGLWLAECDRPDLDELDLPPILAVQT